MLIKRGQLNCICAVFATLAFTLASCASFRPTYQADAERYIRDSERAWAESVATGDTSAVQRILADDFIGIDPKGKMYDKPTMVEDTKSAPKYFLSNRLNDVKIRLFGTTAVAQGSETWERRGGEPRVGRFVWTDTWLYRRGKWQIVAAEDLVAAEPGK